MQKLFPILCLLCLMSCGKTQPQRPSYHNGTLHREDSALVHLVQINEKMAEEADRQILHYANGYAQWESGIWTKGWTTPHSPLQEEEKVMLSMQIYDMDSTLLEDIHESAVVGKYDRMEGLSTMLQELERGQHISLLVPWYIGYGSTGNEHVAPYTNLRIELTIEP